MSNLGRIYEFLSKRVASDVWFATISESVRFQCERAGATLDWQEFLPCPMLMRVIPLGPVYAE